MARQNISSGAKWENIVGYSRAVRIGPLIEVAGTTAAKDGEVLHKGDPYSQAKAIIDIASKALQEAGAALSDVVRTTVYLKDINDWKEVGRAHGEAFKDIKPASTMLQVSAFVDADMLVEIEFTAYLSK